MYPKCLFLKNYEIEVLANHFQTTKLDGFMIFFLYLFKDLHNIIVRLSPIIHKTFGKV